MGVEGSPKAGGEGTSKNVRPQNGGDEKGGKEMGQGKNSKTGEYEDGGMGQG